jgi:acyl carrier protein
MRSDTDRKLRRILSDVLGLTEDQVEELTPDTGLFGHLPELDSMAVAGPVHRNGGPAWHLDRR